MAAIGIPEDVRRFLDEQIESLEHLEILLLLEREGGRPLDAAGIARAVGLAPATTERRLSELQRRGLLVRTETGAYRYAPSSDRVAALMPSLVALYREQRLTVIHAVSERALKRLRNFADAFRLRRDGGDD